ncbi:cation diffusion facilitator family transporter [Anoxybacillus voinovskiensis]|uniref:Cation diffusion facilitator family transporter n=1 Tax=Anoxybacteroides voinovskiense TaxID=230470 RepID=A0A840DY28_9BACL|nr:cation diffusion facilitator family transporter [Anoxybacillus voinovskiensis]MBB4073926.1 cation diffusion facilitator family transporter [Anoxybacillus voinovskiensis]GGJ66076.1 putative transporter YeaB [Anoxybacillus voinovskiensis]
MKPELGAWVSIGSYISLAMIKLIIGYVAHSDGVTADGWNNFSDIISSVAILIGIKIAQKPRDHNHPYGHSRAENISSLIAAFMMMSIGLDVVGKGGMSLFHRKEEVPQFIAAWVGMFSAAIMFVVYSFNKRLSERVNSQALASAAKDHLSDALVSMGTVVGIFGAKWGIWWLDPLAALLIGVIICKTAWHIFFETSHLLTDGFDEQALTAYEQEIASINGVKRVSDVKARMVGNQIILDVTIHVAADLTVAESHEIADEIEKMMKNQYHIETTHVHIEPDLNHS